MAEPVARIRPYKPSDEKQVQFAIGKANMESLAVANRRAYAHPITLSVWVLLACVFIQIMQWWPKSEYGYWGYLRPLPAFGATAVPVMFLIDWLNRPYFEEITQSVLRRPDIFDIASYYSRSPSSGLWILDYRESFIGLIALDASTNSTSDEPVSAPTKPRKQKGTAAVATVRHFYVDEAYRGSLVQDDLLIYAVRHAFQSGPLVKSIGATSSSLLPYIKNSLRSAGFLSEEDGRKVGVLGWKLGKHTLQRAVWEKQYENKS